MTDESPGGRAPERLPGPYAVLRAADSDCSGLSVFWKDDKIASIELPGIFGDGEREKRAAAEWATSFRSVFTHLVPDELQIELRSAGIASTAPDKVTPETVFRAYESRILEDILGLFESTFSRWDGFYYLADFDHEPSGFIFGIGVSRHRRERTVTRALQSWLHGVKTFSVRFYIRRPTAHQRLAVARRTRVS